MNLLQIEVAEHNKGPAVVHAGAGTGKTTTLIGRIEELTKLTSPDRIVMLTFTNSAAEEMRSRAIKSNPACKDMVACTYHKYCGKLLRKYGKTIGIDPSFEIMMPSKYQTLIEYVKSSNDFYENLKDFPSASRLETIFSIMMNNEDISVAHIINGTKYSQYSNEILELYREVKQYGREHGKFNFDDVLEYTNELLDNNYVCHLIADSFDYLMVDEFQDTNMLQLNILLKLSKYNNNIVIVGDVSQSIYKFRGARATNMEKFIESFDYCERYELSFNYRSTQPIIDSVNSIMNHNVQSWEYVDMVANNSNPASKPILVSHTDDIAQANWIIDRVKMYLDKGYNLNQIAIIERRSTASFKLENMLAKAKFPFQKRGGRKFIDYACVSDVISFLSLTLKNDSFNWFNILQFIPGIGSKTATSIADSCKETDFISKHSKKKYYTDLLECYNKIKSLRKAPILEAIEELSDYYFELREVKIENSSKMSSSAKFDAMNNIHRDKEIIKTLKDMAANYTKLREFLDDIALDSLKGTKENDQLLITTIHGAKGLEWPVVILVDCIDEDYKDAEEELRCLYVAMTRAETDLYISVPKMTMRNGEVMYNKLSRFFNESKEFFDIERG